MPARPPADRTRPWIAAVEPSASDGRAARGARTRAAIVDALLGLLDEGELRPTADEIAARAAVSPRSVFQHFPDRETLFAAAAARQGERIAAVARPLPMGAPLAERVAALAAQRRRVHEVVTPVRRAALLHEPFSDVVAGGLRHLRALGRDELERTFAPELDRLPPAERVELLAALDAAAAWPAWESLRAHQGLSPARAEAVVRRTLGALLAPGR